MREVDLGGERSFIGAWYLADLSICDDLITYFQLKDGKKEGEIGHDREVNKAIKDSLDLIIPPENFSHPRIRQYSSPTPILLRSPSPRKMSRRSIPRLVT